MPKPNEQKPNQTPSQVVINFDHRPELVAPFEDAKRIKGIRGSVDLFAALLIDFVNEYRHKAQAVEVIGRASRR